MTTGTVVAPSARRTVLTINTVTAGIALLEIQTLITTPAPDPHTAIEAVRTLLQAGDKATILIVVTGEKQITILVVPTDVCVLAVLILEIGKIAARDAIHQFSDLPEEGTTLIKRFPVRKRIPPISPPLFLLIYGKLRLGCVHGNDLLAGSIALPLIQRSFIAECKTSLLTTVGAELWWRDQLLLSIEHRRKLLEKHEVFRRNLETDGALQAGFLHTRIIYRDADRLPLIAYLNGDSYTAFAPSSSSILRSWLYLQTRSVRLVAPVLI